MFENEMKECTFKPQTNMNSSRMVSYKRQGTLNDRNKQLYDQHGKKITEASLKF